jgi:hypothetical protein
MNESLITADGSTHVKILAVSLLAAIVVIWIGISVRSIAAGSLAATPGIERPNVAAGQAALDRHPALLDML